MNIDRSDSQKEDRSIFDMGSVAHLLSVSVQTLWLYEQRNPRRRANISIIRSAA